MFMTAACIGYAKKHGIKWCVPSDTKEVPRFHEFFPGLNKLDYYGGERYNCHDPSMFNYKEIPYNNSGVQIVGFCQSEKYFMNAEVEVRDAFKLKEYPQFKDYVSIHVRRGDYVQYSNSFPPVSVNYIDQAIWKVEETLGNGKPQLMFFSDDIEWCKEYFGRYDRISFAESDPDNPIENLAMMASCSHNIIANSSYSWWAAWLNKNPDKIVVSPHHTSWFGPGNSAADTRDLIPEKWNQIKFR